MNEPAAFQGNLISVKLVASRGVYVFSIEVDEAFADQALHAIGGLPQAKESRRVAVARISDVSSNP